MYSEDDKRKFTAGKWIFGRDKRVRGRDKSIGRNYEAENIWHKDAFTPCKAITKGYKDAVNYFKADMS